ncbi:MAG: iron ABC transporter permease [Oscillospiraceae bacterium]|nr:iron ABC transporter permease [Oscillospiraceae bacterium]
MGMKQRTPLFVLAGLSCVLACLLSLTLGAAGMPLSTLVQALARPDSTPGRILFLVRLPRTAGCLLAGAALAVSGCVIQGVLANPLASPGIIGVNAGAGFAVTVCCALGALSGWTMALSAFLGALGAAAAIAFFGSRTGASRTTVILAGVAVNAFLGGLSESVTSLFPDVAMLSVDFRVGGFGSVAVSRLMPAGLLILAGLALVCSLHNELDVMSLGADTARGLGMNVKGMQALFLGLAALLAGASVSFAGLLGFVGLIVPHSCRKAVGSEARLLLPLSALTGAAFVTLADLLARLLFAPFELPVGVLLSVLGGPFFLWLLLTRKGGHGDD